jgi:hypothetical protein
MDYAVGSSPERRETATTVQLLQTAANMRFDIKIRNASYAETQAAFMIYERYKQWLTKPIPIQVASIMGTADTAYSADAAIVMQRPPEPEGEQAEPDWTAPQPLVAKVAKGRDMMRYGDVRMTFDPRTSALTEDDD